MKRIALSTILGLGVMLMTISGMAMPDKAERLAALQSKQILVPMWGWPVEEMAPQAVAHGYQVVNAPHGNDLNEHARRAKVWREAGLQMIVRPHLQVTDPFDPESVRTGLNAIEEIIAFHDDDPMVIGYSIAWGLYGEGGFPYDFVFTQHAVDAFNAAMGTPGEPLPEAPAEGQPGSLRWVQWIEFRSASLREFRRDYVSHVKQLTDKLVGTWSEFYPIANHMLNMGDAPGADFLFYDLSFGDVTVDQTIAFGETHANMQHYESYELWRDYVVPLMAKSVGEGVTPLSFQFPMRRGHQADFLSTTTILIDNIEDEYCLKLGPELRDLLDGANGRTREPEVAVVYQSFAAAALPEGREQFWFYQNSARVIEAMLRMMGADLKVIPYEHLASADLTRYKLLYVPDAMYLSKAMRANLASAPCVIYAGEYLLTHREPASEQGEYNKGWSAQTVESDCTYYYDMASTQGLTVAAPEHPWMAGVVFPDRDYPNDQMVTFDPLPADAEVLWTLEDGSPVLFACEKGRVIHVTNRLLNHLSRSDDDWLEAPVYHFLRNVLIEQGVNLRVVTAPQRRAMAAFPYGGYGLSGYIAWNATDAAVTLEMTDGKILTIPAYGWVALDD